MAFHPIGKLVQAAAGSTVDLPHPAPVPVTGG